MKDITPFLWFNTQAKEAADFYVAFSLQRKSWIRVIIVKIPRDYLAGS